MRNRKKIRYYKVRRSSECLDKGGDGAVALIYADLFDSGLAPMSSNLAHKMLSLCGSRFSLPEVPHSAFSDRALPSATSHTQHCAAELQGIEYQQEQQQCRASHQPCCPISCPWYWKHPPPGWGPQILRKKIHPVEHDCGKCTTIHSF